MLQKSVVHEIEPWHQTQMLWMSNSLLTGSWKTAMAGFHCNSWTDKFERIGQFCTILNRVASRSHYHQTMLFVHSATNANTFRINYIQKLLFKLLLKLTSSLTLTLMLRLALSELTSDCRMLRFRCSMAQDTGVRPWRLSLNREFTLLWAAGLADESKRCETVSLSSAKTAWIKS